LDEVRISFCLVALRRWLGFSAKYSRSPVANTGYIALLRALATLWPARSIHAYAPQQAMLDGEFLNIAPIQVTVLFL
jgi:hypothetical protein